jgi:hypothetical protein
MKKIMILAAMFVAALSAQANLALNITTDNVTFDGVSNYANGDFFMYLIDVNGDGIAAPTDIAFNPGSDDYLVASGDGFFMDMDGYRGYTYTGDQSLDFATYQNKNVYLVAFDGITSSELAPGAGTDYVIWRSSAMSLPGLEGGSLLDAYSFNPAEATYAQTIPEPATALLIAIGGGMAYVIRRKSNILAN